MIFLILNICGIKAFKVLKLLNLVCPNVLQKYLVTGYTIDITCSTIINFRFLWGFFYFNDLRKLQIKWMTLKCFPPTFCSVYHKTDFCIWAILYEIDLTKLKALSTFGILNSNLYPWEWYKPFFKRKFKYFFVVAGGSV